MMSSSHHPELDEVCAWARDWFYPVSRERRARRGRRRGKPAASSGKNVRLCEETKTRGAAPSLGCCCACKPRAGRSSSGYQAGSVRPSQRCRHRDGGHAGGGPSRRENETFRFDAPPSFFPMRRRPARAATSVTFPPSRCRAAGVVSSPLPPRLHFTSPRVSSRGPRVCPSRASRPAPPTTCPGTSPR